VKANTPKPTDDLDSALAKLRAEGDVTLTDLERKALLAWVSAEKRPRGRPRRDTAAWVRRFEMAVACHNARAGGASVNDAVAATAQEFGVSQPTVRMNRQMFKRAVLRAAQAGQVHIQAILIK
jgi:hypothetical protein